MKNISYARLQAAINHRESDRIPFDLGSTKMTGISAIAYKLGTPVTTGTKKGANATEKGNHRVGSFFMQRC